MTDNFQAQSYGTTYTDISLDLLMVRLQNAGLISLITTVLVVSIGFVFYVSSLPPNFAINGTFLEWTLQENEAECPNHDNPACVGDVLREFEISISRLGNNLFGLFQSTRIDDETSYLGGVARLLSVISISIAVFYAYRRHLEERYIVENKRSQLEDFRDLKEHKLTFFFTRILYTAATFFGSYIVISLAWVVLSQIFRGLSLTTIWAWMVIGGFVFASTFASTYWAIAVSTRELVLIGVGTFVLGFAVSFAVAPLMINPETMEKTDTVRWWTMAISSAGKLQPAASLFTSALASLAVVFWIVWFDIDSIIEMGIAKSGEASVPIVDIDNVKWVHVNRKYLIIVCYTFVIVGLLSIGLVRVDRPASDFALNIFFHSILGAGGAILGLFFVCWHVKLITRRTIFTLPYRVYFIIGAIISAVALGLYTFLGVNLTAVELVIFTISGSLMVITIEILLLQADIIERENAVQSET